MHQFKRNSLNLRIFRSNFFYTIAAKMNQRTGNEAHPARILFTEAKSFSTCVAISRCAYNTAAAAPVDRSAALHSPVLYISNSTSISEKGLRVVPRHRPKTAMKNIYKAIVSSQLPVLNVTCRSSRTTKHRSSSHGLPRPPGPTTLRGQTRRRTCCRSPS